ncbi:MAG TPA: Crp/Fnr family transcriptional regulator [Flavobacteriaceae bacterium]|nr:MAG: Global nitrogen regulator [Flavobacteriaceae bacterium]HCQ24222.1 Crp/Fnr family transcriptional regulator [Flavobacteriaceae bacterium]
MLKELQHLFGGVLEKELIEEINSVATYAEAPIDKELMQPGKYIKTMPILLEGSIKILRPDDDGQRLLLYHLEQGQTCAMTLNCCIGSAKSEIYAVSETPVRLLQIPVQKMEEWLGRYRSWRNFVLNSYHNRMMELLESVDRIAFNNMEERLESYLNEKKKMLGDSLIKITHQQVANDLHSSRVVVSRLLKKLERNGTISLQRNAIEMM